MFPLLLCRSAETNYTLNDTTITSIVLNDGDTVYIDGRDFNVYLFTSPHFFFGELEITSTYFDLSNDFKAQPSQRFLFNNAEVTLKYTKAHAPCKVDIYIIRLGICTEQSIHIRGARKSRIFSENFGYLNTQLCYFYSFEEEPRFTFTIPNSTYANVNIFYQDENSTFQFEEITEIKLKKLPKLFGINLCSGNMSNYDLKFDTDLKYGDWTENNSFFNCWPTHLCSPDTDLDYHVTADRSVAFWIWATLIGGIAIPLVIFVVCMLMKPDDAGFSGNSIQPLLSLQSK